MGTEPTAVHLEPVRIEGAVRPFLVGRVYYSGGSFDDRSPFDAVFVVVLEGGGRAFAMAAHGKISVRAYGLIARQLLDQYGVHKVDMTRHRRAVGVETVRASGFGEPRSRDDRAALLRASSSPRVPLSRRADRSGWSGCSHPLKEGA